MTNNKKVSDNNIAVLIDAENVAYANITGVLREIARYGNPTIKRIYGDWTRQTASGWKSHLLAHAITPIQQYSYTAGKNSSDSALIIDAMDILFEGKIDTFCIVSSDSDFTRLCVRLRESAKYVIGIGEQKTPSPFIASCDKFIYMENIDLEETDEMMKKATLQTTEGQKLYDLIKQSVMDLADENGYVFMGDLGNFIAKKQPDFDPRTYGFHQLTPLIKAMDIFEIDERRIPNSNVKHVYIRLK